MAPSDLCVSLASLDGVHTPFRVLPVGVTACPSEEVVVGEGVRLGFGALVLETGCKKLAGTIIWE
jgi:hypothetical protein